MDRVFITGGAGFIGSHLATHFVTRGDEVVVLDDLSTGHASNLEHLAGDVRLVVGDVRDADLVRREMAGARWVLHHAAMVSVPLSIEHPNDCHGINATGTLNVLEAAREAGAECVTFAASAAAYGQDPTLPKRESMAPSPISPYAATKLLGEHYCATWSAAFGLPCVALRYFNIFGERQDPAGPYAAVISKFLDRMLAGQPPIIFGDGSQTRDFCHVSNVVAANAAALNVGAPATGSPINVGTGSRTSLLDLLETLNKILGTSFEPEFREERAGDVRHSVADIERARTVIRYEPVVGFQEGLRRLVDSLTGAG